MYIPIEAVWGILSALVVVIGWSMTLERRLNSRLTREEHDLICQEKHREVMRKLEKLESLHERSVETRNQILRELELKIAVLETLLLRGDPSKMVADRIRAISRGASEGDKL